MDSLIAVSEADSPTMLAHQKHHGLRHAFLLAVSGCEESFLGDEHCGAVDFYVRCHHHTLGIHHSFVTNVIGCSEC